VARRPLERERIYCDGGRRTTQLMRDSLASALTPTSINAPIHLGCGPLELRSASALWERSVRRAPPHPNNRLRPAAPRTTFQLMGSVSRISQPPAGGALRGARGALEPQEKGALSNKRMKRPWRGGRLKVNGLILIAAATPRRLCAIR